MEKVCIVCEKEPAVEGERVCVTCAETAPGLMAQAMDTFFQRQKDYGKSYYTFGEIMANLFPHGVELKTMQDFNRFHLITQQVIKQIRYCTDFHKPHQDSVRDQGVYSFMLEEVDRVSGQ